jgi:hypothetical protein
MTTQTIYSRATTLGPFVTLILLSHPHIEKEAEGVSGQQSCRSTSRTRLTDEPRERVFRPSQGESAND